MVPALQLLQTKKAQRLLGVPGKQRVRAFAAFVLEHGEAALIRALQKNEADGVLYHYPGRLVGDYDLPENGSAIRAMLLRGLEEAQESRF